MGTRTLLSFGQFEQLPDDGKKHELVRGELILMPPPKLRHTRIQRQLGNSLRPYLSERKLGEVEIKAGFLLNPQTWLQPDVSFVRTSQIATADPDGYCEGSPALAVEVISESNTAKDLEIKIDECFAHGAEEVWILYPQTQRIWKHYRGGHSETISGGDLRSDLSPEWSVPAASLFEA